MTTPPLRQALLLLLPTLACARERETPPTPAEPELGAAQVEDTEPLARGATPMTVEAEWAPTEDELPQWRITTIYLDVGLAELCGIPAANTTFEVDSAQLDEQARARVAEVAQCFTEGPLREREVLLIGRADPRGTDAYNRELGMSRAESVAAALQREGLGEARIDVISRGEAGASEDPAQWDDARRVDIRIADAG